jgi:hypothetical protein
MGHQEIDHLSSRLPDGNFTTEWHYRFEGRDNGKIDITYDSTNKPSRTR